jgi:drug/metabolite transporter (DMT)-like permease
VIAWALLVVPGMIWGASFPFIAEGLEAVGPTGVTFIRILVGFLTLSLIPAARRPILRSDRAGTAALGVLWLAFPLSMFPFAEQHVSSALTGMLNGATPLFAASVASLIARRLPPRAVAVGLAVGSGGAVTMALPDLGLDEGSTGQTFGVVLILAALISYGPS